MESRLSQFTVMTEENTYEPLDEEMIRQAIGGLLPDDDDLLESMHGMNLNKQLEEDIDIFSSGGGLEMDGDIQGDSRKSSTYMNRLDDMIGSSWTGSGSTFNGRSYVEHPSRTLFVRSINSSVEDSELWALFEPFGDIRGLYTACKHRGFVMVSYFDIRAATKAMHALQNKQLRNKRLDIHFSFPKENPSDRDMNQGTLIIFNLDPSISNDFLHEIFGKYGKIKEILETPQKSHHRFIEFYDIRDAESALKGMNNAMIGGRRIKLEPSHPGGTQWGSTGHYSEQLEQGFDTYDTQSSSPGLSFFSPGAQERFGSPIESVLQRPVQYSPKTWSYLRRHSYHDTKPYNTNIKTSCSLTPDLSQSQMRSKFYVADSPTVHNLLQTEFTGSKNFIHGEHNSNFYLDLHQLYPNRDSSTAEKLFSFSQNSPDTPLYGPGSLGSGVPVNLTNAMVKNLAPGYDNSTIKEMPSHQCLGMLCSPLKISTNVNNYDLPNGRLQRMESNTRQLDCKNIYQLDLNRILLGQDTRTTLMIKNIPNKYTVEMLLEAIDKTHWGMYDFVYLPIDFKNNCNVGYAFINMRSPAHIISIYEALDGKRWERFNSEKVACLAYARIQGITALVAHFQNSSLMNEEKRCQPILFDKEGRRRMP